MKNKKLKELALLGLAGGLLLNSQLLADTQKTEKTETTSAQDDPNKGNLGYRLMTEDELLLELTDEGANLYNSLSPEGKELAIFVASQRCQGSNECKGLNACQTDTNDCAGKGQCKGTGKCAVADKNLAVKIVAKKMAEKRAALGKSKK